ncbi:GPO family capsid scaffolding protein, partial [Xanthomonas citri]
SPFRAYGDVTAVKAEEVEIDGAKRLALFAQIEPTADLITINKSKQKLYTSIEVQEKFANTGKAYLVGLA